MKTRRLTAILTLACLSAMLALSVAPIWSASAQTAEKTVAENAPPKADPVMTEELMARLIKRTLASKKDFAIPAATCSVFNLCEAGHDLPAKQVSMIVPEGKHVIMVPLKEDSKDVVIAFGTQRVLRSI